MKRRVRVLVSGVVQGVNFRVYTRNAAEKLGLAGWVRNLGDGRVELEAEGDPGTVDRLLEAVRRGPVSARVEDVRVTDLQEPGSYEGFDLRRTADRPEGS